MADLIWPEIYPYRAMFYLQPYNDRKVSPFTRKQKVYDLAKPRFVCRLTFRTGYNGETGVGAWGGELDAFIAEMKGGANRVALWDFRRPYPVGLKRYYRQFAGQRYSFLGGETFQLGEHFHLPAEAEPTNEFAPAGATEMTFVGFLPGEKVFLTGDYIGGDGRAHIVLRPEVVADQDGRAKLRFLPPLEVDVLPGMAKTLQPTSWFTLASDDAGQNETTVGELTEYTLDFVEDLG